MPLPGWIPPAFRRDISEKKAAKAAVAMSPDLQARALPGRTGYVPGIPQGGIDEYQQSVGASTGSDRRSLMQELFDSYLSVPWSWTCVQVIARTITAGGLYTDWDADTGEGDEAPDKPPAVIALERFYAFCNPTQDIRQLLRNAIADLEVFGDALLEVVWDGPTPVALYNLDVVTTYPQADEHGTVTGWVQLTDFGQRAEFEPRDVIHISLDSARPGITGVSPTQAMLQPMMAWLFAAAAEKEMLRKGLPPNIHADLPAGTSDTDVTRWDNQYRTQNLGSRNIGNPIKTRGGGKITELATGKLADILEAKDKARDEILSGYLVPPAEAGVIESREPGRRHRGQPAPRVHAQHLRADRRDRAGEAELPHRRAGLRGAGVAQQVQGGRLPGFDGGRADPGHQARNGTWTRNRYAAEIGEPPVDGGDLAVLVDRQNLVLWSDMEAMSHADGGGEGPGPLACSRRGRRLRSASRDSRAPRASPPLQRAMLREALRRYHAAGQALYEDAQSACLRANARRISRSRLSAG